MNISDMFESWGNTTQNAWGNNTTGNFFSSINPFSSQQGTPLNSLFGETGLISNPTEAWDQFKNGKTNIVNKQIADENLAFQQENLDYQKALQETIFNREDTSYQRTVNDMIKAGLNPLTMNGQNDTGEVIPTEAKHNDFVMQDQGFGAMANEIFNAMNKLNYYQIGENINQKSKAEADIKTQEAENYENTITKLKAEIENLKANTNNTNETTRGKKHTNDYNEKYGVNSEMPLIERIGAYTNSEGQKEDNKDYNNKINNTINKTKEKLTNTYAKKV